MSQSIINTILFAIAFLLLFGIAELLYHYLKVKVELTRKFVHFGTGLLTLMFPLLLDNHWMVLMLCISFLVILIGSLRYNLLKSINAIERKSVGSIAYPIAVYGCYLAYDFYDKTLLFYYLPILILAISDPLAALVGKTWPWGVYKSGEDKKTLMGSMAFFVSAFFVSLACLYFMKSIAINGIVLSVGVAFLSSLVEAFSKNGFDNFSIPASVLICLILFN